MIPDLFSGPGGWEEAARMLGLPQVAGFELDGAACATRAAAGHVTVRADVARYPAEALGEKIAGLIASPPCTTFSAAGKRAGAEVLDILEDAIGDAFAGRLTRATHRKDMARTLRLAWWPSPKLTRERRSAKIWQAVRSASLVIEPARFIRVCYPEWVAMEQVPGVLPLWEVYAAELRKMGYSAWCGVLNSAFYGVPQTRMRAILAASRVRTVGRPQPTHYDPRKGDQLFGERWVTMAEALGWGASVRPSPAVTAGGTATGGAEPFARGGRDLLAGERDGGQWLLRNNNNNNNNNACSRRPDEPAPTMFFGHRSNWAAWVRERPATTVQGDPRVGRPGHKERSTGGESQFAVDSVRITVEEAAALQSFPPGYPWRGTKTKQFEQVGNAIPPLLAMHVLAAASGTALPLAGEVAA